MNLLPPRASGPLCLFTVAKKCYRCGTEWVGTAFAEYPKDRQPLPGCCATCNDRTEAEIRARAVRHVAPESPPPFNLKRPAREPEQEEWYDR